MEENLHFKIHWPSLIGQFSKYKPPGHLYLEGRFNGGFFTLPVWGSYMDGLIFGILRYFIFHRSHSALVSHSFAAHPSYMPSFLEHIFYGVLKEK